MKKNTILCTAIVIYLSVFVSFKVTAGGIHRNDLDPVSHRGRTDAQRERTHPPLHGFSGQGSGVYGESGGQGIGITGYNDSTVQPAARFRNWGTGDHLIIDYGRTVPALRVGNNGDVFVRGRLLGQQGEKGEKGDPGTPGQNGTNGSPGPIGPTGPAVRTVAVCAATTNCGCSGRTVTGSLGICSVSSDTGSCSSNTETGCCAVCAP